MGIPQPLVNCSIFPRTFRFLLIPQKNPHLQYFIKKAKVKYYEKTLEIDIYENEKNETHDWVLKLSELGYKEDFTLIALNGLGVELYVLQFSGVQGVAHEVDYDYASSEVVTHQLILDYEKMERIHVEQPQKNSAADSVSPSQPVAATASSGT